MAKLTEEELRKIIQEELKDIDEGALDRFLARAKGKASSVGSGLKNITKGASQLYKGQTPQLADIDKVRKYSTALSIVKSTSKKVLPQLDKMKKDIEKMIEDDKSLEGIKAFQGLIGLSNKATEYMQKVELKMSKDLQNIKKKG
jgi:hypothetical protein